MQVIEDDNIEKEEGNDDVKTEIPFDPNNFSVNIQSFIDPCKQFEDAIYLNNAENQIRSFISLKSANIQDNKETKHIPELPIFARFQYITNKQDLELWLATNHITTFSLLDEKKIEKGLPISRNK